MSVAAVVPVPHRAPSTTCRRSPWSRWRTHFEENRHRPLPPVGEPPPLPPAVRAQLASTLARFQLGETGEGRIIAAVAQSELKGMDDDYRRALALFIGEEGRHARILAQLVRALGGDLLARAWTERLFVAVRRLAGVRFKLLAMFAAEVVGAGFYGALAASLPDGAMRAALAQIAGDEHAHLRFHRRFFAIAAPRGWRRLLFLAAWLLLAHAAALVVLWDHRHTMRALGISTGDLTRRLRALIREGAL